MNEVNKPTGFSFEDYKILDIWYDSLADQDLADHRLRVMFDPIGKFDSGMFGIILRFSAFWAKDESEIEFLKLGCIANFSFPPETTLEDIPEYFYVNSIAIFFPYLRAFISNLTVQANQRPFILPLMNLTSLGQELKANTSNLKS